MADNGVATKAPESDAQEENKTAAEQISGIPGDSQPDQGAASMGRNAETKQEVTKYGDIDVYITKPADYPHQPSKLLLLLTGGTGIQSTNNKLQADKFASEGFLVVMPDQFAGDPAPTTTTTAQAEQSAGILEQVKLGVASVAKSFTIDMWLARHTPEKVLPILQKVITSVKEEFADAVANGGGIYAVGYCFGARYVLLLGSELDKEAASGLRSPDAAAEEGMVRQGAQIKAGAIAHGTQIGKEDLEGVSVPLCIVAVKDDSLFPDHIRDEGKKALEAKKLEHEMKVYPGVPHGFAVYGDYDDEKIKQSQEEAFKQMLDWLKSH
ncbi:uncharacterized protein LTR77_006156 [Saxophila tyrrhenica]|uniref:Dienelactone hydrolase domain-containing protein n=1 Tax=Saxophila tyrrhenica TaxID=1690608 RepID=A0AAV9PA44_9PEZI|nr:hypothetical protein LTR77_006156 [Saxophila tyrrhenica]